MKRINLLILTVVLLNVSTIKGYCQNYSIKLKEGEQLESPNLKGYRNLVGKLNLKTGTEEIINLNNLGIYKPIRFIYDDSRDILFVEDYLHSEYVIHAVALKEKRLVKTIMLKIGEPDITMAVNPSSGFLYITYWDNTGDWVTSTFNSNYEILRKTDIVINNELVFASKNKGNSYLISYSNKDKKDYFITLDENNGDIVEKKDLSNLAIKGEYARIRDGKEGELLLEYREDDKYITYILYDPLNDKVVSKIDKVPWHVGNVYLDDSLDNIIINDAKFVKVNNKTERQYTNKILVYSFSKKGKVKEIPIKEGSKIEAVKDKIYLKQNNSIRSENLK